MREQTLAMALRVGGRLFDSQADGSVRRKPTQRVEWEFLSSQLRGAFPVRVRCLRSPARRRHKDTRLLLVGRAGPPPRIAQGAKNNITTIAMRNSNPPIAQADNGQLSAESYQGGPGSFVRARARATCNVWSAWLASICFWQKLKNSEKRLSHFEILAR